MPYVLPLKSSLKVLSQSVLLFLLYGAAAGCVTTAAPGGDPWLARDKALHFIAGAAIGAVGAGIAQSTDFSPCGATSSGIGLAFSIGLGKEWNDGQTGAGTVSGRDLLATVAGGIVGAQLVGECHR